MVGGSFSEPTATVAKESGSFSILEATPNDPTLFTELLDARCWFVFFKRGDKGVVAVRLFFFFVCGRINGDGDGSAFERAVSGDGDQEPLALRVSPPDGFGAHLGYSACAPARRNLRRRLSKHPLAFARLRGPHLPLCRRGTRLWVGFFGFLDVSSTGMLSKN